MNQIVNDCMKNKKQCQKDMIKKVSILKWSYDAISSFPFSLECYKLFVHR